MRDGSGCLSLSVARVALVWPSSDPTFMSRDSEGFPGIPPGVLGNFEAKIEEVVLLRDGERCPQEL